MTYRVEPLTPERWGDLEQLFGPNGACAGCWCMWWRLTHSQWKKQRNADNKIAFKKLIDAGEVPGLLIYAAGRPVGWCGVAPREKFPRLERSRLLQRVDEEPVWSVTCFFVKAGWRRRGVALALLEATLDFVRQRGGRLIEGYPIDPRGKASVDSWTGYLATFRMLGFEEIARRSPTRPVMRKPL